LTDFLVDEVFFGNEFIKKEIVWSAREIPTMSLKAAKLPRNDVSPRNLLNRRHSSQPPTDDLLRYILH
jgi:hypothetical protein